MGFFLSTDIVSRENAKEALAMTLAVLQGTGTLDGLQIGSPCVTLG